VELANLPGGTLMEVADQAQRGIQRVCASDDLVAGFLAIQGSPSTMTSHLAVKLNSSHPDVRSGYASSTSCTYTSTAAALKPNTTWTSYPYAKTP
jgi:hypothetical protein